MGAGLIFLFFVAGGIVVIVLAIAHQRRANDVWSAAARRLGLHFSPGNLFSRRRMTGVLEGNSVVVETYSTGGKNSKTYTRYRVYYPRPLGLGLNLSRQGLFSGISRFFGGQDIEIGEAEFDADVVIKGADPSRVIKFLTPARRLRAHRLLNALSGCVIADDEIRWSSRGLELSEERIVSAVHRINRVALHMTGERAGDARLDRAITVQREGRLDEALTLVREASADESDDILDAQVLEAEILYTGGQYDQAAKVFEQARRQDPDDAEVAAWAEQAARQAATLPPKPPERVPPDSVSATPEPTGPAAPTTAAEPVAPPPPVSSAPPSPAGPASPHLEAPSVCESLFAPEKMSFEITRTFEQHYQGNRVQWSGTLRTVDDYSYDLVFGTEPGGKAVFEIHELTDRPYGGRRVQAVVRLPAADVESLRERIGKTLTFSGTLVSCDSFMRNLYLADGSMEGA